MNNQTKRILLIVFLMAAALTFPCSGAQQTEKRNTPETAKENNSGNMHWKKYQDSKKSGIAAYTYSSDRISIKFRSGSIYEYTYSSAGKRNIEKMKKLADKGSGLNSFINKKVRHKYSKKQRRGV